MLQGRSLDSLENFPEPGFDMDEITAVANLEIHFVDSSGVVSWDFLGEEPDHAFADMKGSAIHGKLLAAYDKLFVPVNKH